MQLQELTQLVDRGHQAFAIYPAIITATLPESVTSRVQVRRSCPLGLVKGYLLDDHAEWDDHQHFGCGPSAHVIKRSTGARFRVPLSPEIIEESHVLKTLIGKLSEGGYEYAEVSHQDDGDHLLITVSRRAIVMPWTDYEPITASRRKERREERKREARISAAARAIGGTETYWQRDWNSKSETYNQYPPELAKVSVTLPTAETLADLLSDVEEIARGFQLSNDQSQRLLVKVANVRAATTITPDDRPQPDAELVAVTTAIADSNHKD